MIILFYFQKIYINQLHQQILVNQIRKFQICLKNFELKWIIISI
jgi:hypothetical protein